MESLIPAEIGELSLSFAHATEESNEEEMTMSLDLVNGRREMTLIHMVAQKKRIKKYYNHRINY